MKTAICQYYIGKDIPNWVKISKSKFKRYAEKFDADYFFWTDPVYAKDNYYFENLRIVYDEYFSLYDRVLYVDVDVIPENMDENIFDLEIEDIGMVPEYRHINMDAPPLFALPEVEHQYRLAAKYFKVPVRTPKSIMAPYLMFNSGVILWSKEGILKAKEKFIDYHKWHDTLKASSHMCLDQPFINGQVSAHLNYTELNLKWNCYPRFRFYPDKIPPMNFVHYTGGKKKYIPELYKEEV